MFYWYPIEAFQALTSSGTAEEALEEEGPTYAAWLEQMQIYQRNLNSAEKPVNFWIVLALPGDKYSDEVEWHKELPMLVPTPGSGKLLGVASGKEQVNELIAKDPGNVHLVFKAKLLGETAWRQLLEFLGTHAMLEKEG